MMLPVPFSSMGRAKTWLARIAPVRLVSRMAAHSSSETSRLGVRLVRPAAFSRMSTLPKACRTASRSFSRDTRSVTSEGTRRLRRPLASTALAVSSTTSARREVATTSAPASARPMAMARPRPEVPPRTTATLPARSRAASPTSDLLKVVYGMRTLPEARTRFRWVVCALIFLATTVNYIDRQVLGILAPDLQREIGWNEIEYGYIVMAFQGAYAIGLVLSGGLLDHFGTKVGYAVALVLWSLAAMAHAFARTPFGFGSARFALGLGEAANFPAAIKSVAEWFPKRERAFATGLFNSGTNIGAVVAPVVVPPLAAAYGWPSAFIVTGAIGLLWLVLWLPLYGPPETHPRVSPVGARPHPQRSARDHGQGPLAPSSPLPADLGLCPGQVPHRSHLVVLSLLDPQVPARAARNHPDPDGAAPRGHLSHRRRGQHRRGLALLPPHPLAASP